MAERFNNFWKNVKKGKRKPKKNGKKTNGMSLQIVKDIVKKEISRNIENKTFQFYSGTAPIPIFSVASTDFNSGIQPISPYSTRLQIDQGTGQGNRVGNMIKIKRATITGTIIPVEKTTSEPNVNPNPRPTQVAIWLFYDRADPNAIPSPKSNFFQLGNSVHEMQGNLQDLMSPINNDRYKVVHRRIYKIGYADYVTEAGVNRRTNNDFKYNQKFKIDYTKWLIKTVKFADADTTPTTRGLYFMIAPYACTGETYGVAEIPVEYFYNLDLEYEDA